MRSCPRCAALITVALALVACERAPTAPEHPSADVPPPVLRAPLFDDTGPFSLLITPIGFDFGDVQVGATAPQQSVNVTNISGAPMTLSMAGGAAGPFGGVQNCQSVTIAPGGSCQISYDFSPTAPGEITSSTNGNINGQSFAFTFRGNGVAPRFRVSPTAIDFGDLQIGQSLSLSVDVENIGLAPVVVSMAGGAAGPFGGVQNCQSVTLARGAVCHVTYTFAPSAVGEITATTNGNFNGQPFAFSFRGNGVAPHFRVSPTSLDFGQVQVGSSLTLPITVTNVGPPATVSMAGGAAGGFGGVQNCQGVTLATGASCQVSYTFSPTSVGVLTASTNGNFNGQPFAFSLKGTGIANGSSPTAPFRIAHTALDFGDVQVGQSLTQSIDVVNITASPIVVAMAGGAAGQFGGVQNCQSVTLPPGGSCQVSYTFAPSTPGVVTASTNGNFNGQPFEFSFRGNGVAPRFRVSPTSIDFGDVQIGTTLAQSVTVTNVGLATATVAMAGGAAGPFGGVQDCQSVALAVGASCHVTYEFSPTATGVVTGSTNGNFNGQQFNFSFTGNGIRPRLLVTPVAFDFGAIAVGATTPQQSVTVKNIGLAAATISMAGGAAGVFGGVQNCQSVSLLPGASCQISYAFTPTAPGIANGSTNGNVNGVPFAFTMVGLGLGGEHMDLSPGTISLSSTPTTSAVLLSSPTFDARTVTLANVRMLVNGTTDVAPISRGTIVVSSTRDWNGDGLMDRLFTFQTSALAAAGLHAGAGANALVLRDNISAQKWQAADSAPPTIVP